MSTGPGVNTGGNVRINDLCQIGIGASIKDKVTIKKNTIIGGGAFVNKNCDSNSTYFGVPAKKIKEIENLKIRNHPPITLITPDTLYTALSRPQALSDKDVPIATMKVT